MKAALAVSMVLIMAVVALDPAIESEAATGPLATADIPEGRDYLYKISQASVSLKATNNNSYTMTYANITDVLASVDHSAMRSVMRVAEDSEDASARARTAKVDLTSKGDENNRNTINKFWDFDPETGMGPFNCFYAAVNLYSGTNDDDTNEVRRSTNAGSIAYVLDPYDVKKTLFGTTYSSALYNIMLIVPTVYWTASGGTIYLSNQSSYDIGDNTIISGMSAYAHTSTFNSVNTIHRFIGIAVYEGSALTVGGKTTMVSQPGKAPANNQNMGTFNGWSNNNPRAGDGMYLNWNYYQWTLLKFMSYSVMGTKNSQLMVGPGITNAAQASTGTVSSNGPYFGTTSNSQGVMMFVENPWGNVSEFLGGTYDYTDTGRNVYRRVIAGTSLVGGYGGSNIGQITRNNGTSLIQTINTGSAGMDLPAGTGLNVTIDDNITFWNDVAGAPEYNRDTWVTIWVGGGSYSGSAGGINYVVSDGRDRSGKGTSIGARTAYFMDDEAEETTTTLSVTYDMNMGTGIPPVPLCADTGAVFTVDNPGIPGLLGWSKTPGLAGEIDYAFGQQVVITEDLILYAKWEHPIIDIAKSGIVDISYRVNGGEVIPWTEGRVHLNFHDGFELMASGITEEQSLILQDNAKAYEITDSYRLDDVMAYHSLVLRVVDPPPEPVPPEPEPEDDPFVEDDDDDIFDILRGINGARAAEDDGHTFKWIIVAAAATLVGVASCLVMLFPRR